MALPDVKFNFQGGKKEIANIVKDIGKAIFTSTRASLESATKLVVPDVASMVADITDDLSSGPIERFKDGIRKLDTLVGKLGINLEDYSKELAEFLKLRQEKSIKSEETVNQLRTQNIKAQVNEFGEVVILTKEQIIQQEQELKNLNKEIKSNQKELGDFAKIQKKGGELSEDQQKRLVEVNNNLIENTDKRNEVLQNLNKTEDQDNRTAREKFNDAVDEYVPDQLREIGSAFTEGLMAPFTAIKELGMLFGSMLKPLKALPKLLKGFMVGLIGALAATLPYILVAAAIVAGLVLLKKAFDFLKEKVDENREKLIEFKDKIVAIPGQIKDFFDEKFDALGVAFDSFVEDVKALPGQISDFFEGIFNKIQNFFIDAINSVIELINDIKPFGEDIKLLEKVATGTTEGPVSSDVLPPDGEGFNALMEKIKGTKSVDTDFPVNELSVIPQINKVQPNNAAVAVNNTNVNNNTSLGSFTSSQNNDHARISLYTDNGS